MENFIAKPSVGDVVSVSCDADTYYSYDNSNMATGRIHKDETYTVYKVVDDWCLIGNHQWVRSACLESNTTIEQPIQQEDIQVEEPIQEQEVQVAQEEPVAETIEEPVEEIVEEPTIEPVEEVIEEIIEEPVQDTIEEPVEEPIEEPMVEEEEIVKEEVVEETVKQDEPKTEQKGLFGKIKKMFGSK